MNLGATYVIQKCHHCPEAIGPVLLPAAIRLRIAEGLQGSLPGGFHLIAACPACTLVSTYQASEIRPSDTKVDRTRPPSDKRAIRLAMLCGEGHCGTLVTIDTTAVVGSTISEVLESASMWTFDASCACPKRGHPLRPSGKYVLDGIGILPEDSSEIS